MKLSGGDFSPALQERLLELAGSLAVPELRAAASHILGRGKLYRPRLMQAAFQACGGSPEVSLLDPACAIEIVHTFTLVHDDLPCMDNASLRRGLPAVHLAHGEALAVLAGDALLNLAYLCLAKPRWKQPDAAQQMIRVLAQAVQEVVEGQAVDIRQSQAAVGKSELEQMFRWKTGALLGAACEMGALAAGAALPICAALSEIGCECGVLFQIRDDLLSHTSTEAHAGKSLGVDSGKTTALSLLGFAAASQWAETLKSGLTDRIAQLGLPQPEALQELVLEAYDRGC